MVKFYRIEKKANVSYNSNAVKKHSGENLAGKSVVVKLPWKDLVLWLSLTYNQLFLTGPLGYIQSLHRTDVH